MLVPRIKFGNYLAKVRKNFVCKWFRLVCKMRRYWEKVSFAVPTFPKLCITKQKLGYEAIKTSV